jgi:UDP-N-acetylmuramoylalanine--D-glutamate ligase
MGAEAAGIKEGLASFEPLPNRLEPVGSVGGVEYVNDSKATNPDSVVKAVSAFGERRVLLLMGGRGKGSDFADVAAAVAGRDVHVICFGESNAAIAADLAGAAVVESAPRMIDAVRRAGSLATPGDVVLLSPGCASFDEFRDYAHRGQVFAEEVERLGSEGRRDG